MPTEKTAVPASPTSDQNDELLTELREALANGGLTLCYQPLVRSADGELVGIEALLRWNNSSRGDVSPRRFIPVAESAGLMPEIGRWVIATAIREMAEWQRLGLFHDRTLHINLTLRELLDPQLVPVATQHVLEAGLQPEQLCFELTERELDAGAEPAEEATERIAAAGFRLVLDDFGVDSSVEILTRHPFQFAKIDHALLAGESRPRHWARLLRGIGGLARSLGIVLIVEGVEGEKEMGHVAALGFTHAQGYAFGRPDTGSNLRQGLGAGAWAETGR